MKRSISVNLILSFLALFSVNLVRCNDRALSIDRIADVLACINNSQRSRSPVVRSCCQGPCSVKSAFSDLFNAIFVIDNQLRTLSQQVGDFDRGLIQEIIDLINSQLSAQAQIFSSKINLIENDVVERGLLIGALISQLETLTTTLTQELQQSLNGLTNQINTEASLDDAAIILAAGQFEQQFQQSSSCIETAQNNSANVITALVGSVIETMAVGFSQTDAVVNDIEHSIQDQLGLAVGQVVQAQQATESLLGQLALQVITQINAGEKIPFEIKEIGEKISKTLTKDFGALTAGLIRNQANVCNTMQSVQKTCGKQDTSLIEALIVVQGNIAQSGKVLQKDLAAGLTALIATIEEAQQGLLRQITCFGCNGCAHIGKVQANLLADINEQYEDLNRGLNEQLYPRINQLGCLQRVAIGETSEQLEILRSQLAGQYATINNRLSRLDKALCVSNSEVLHLLRRIEGQLVGQVCLKLSGLERDQIVQRNAIIGQTSDFQTQIINQICAKIVGAETDLSIQSGGLRSKACCIELDLCSLLSEEFAALSATLDAFGAQISSKVSGLQTDIGVTIEQQVANVFSELSNINSQLFQEVNEFQQDIGGLFSQDLSDLLVQLAARNSLFCQTNAHLEALAVSEVDFICQKFSKVETDVSFALLNLAEPLLAKIAAVDSGLTQALMGLDELDGLVATMQLGYLTLKYGPFGVVLAGLAFLGFQGAIATVEADPTLAGVVTALTNPALLAAIAIIAAFAALA